MTDQSLKCNSASFDQRFIYINIINRIKNAFPGWTSAFEIGKPVTMTLDTEKGELTLFNSEQVSLGTYRNDDFKIGVFYPACTVFLKKSKVSISKLTPTDVPVSTLQTTQQLQTIIQPQQQQFKLNEKEQEAENVL